MWQAKVLNCSLHNVWASLLERRSAPLIFGKCDNSNELRSIMKRKKKASSTRSAIKAHLLHSHHVHGCCFVFIVFQLLVFHNLVLLFMLLLCRFEFQNVNVHTKNNCKELSKTKAWKKVPIEFRGTNLAIFFFRLLCSSFNYFFQTVYLSISCKLKLLCILRDFFPRFCSHVYQF